MDHKPQVVQGFVHLIGCIGKPGCNDHYKRYQRSGIHPQNLQLKPVLEDQKNTGNRPAQYSENFVEIIDRKMSGLNKQETDCRRMAAETGNEQIKTGLLEDFFLQKKISKISYGAQQVKYNDNKNKNFHVCRPLRVYPNAPLTIGSEFKKKPTLFAGHFPVYLALPHLFIINVLLRYLPFGPMNAIPLMIRTHTLGQKFQKVRN